MYKTLLKGNKAPQFEATDVLGKKVKLSDSKNKYTLLVFLRYAGCPFCNLALHRLALEQKHLSNSRCEVIAFIQSSKENIVKNIYERHKNKPEFSIISDQTEEYYKLYDVKTSVKAIIKSITKIPYWIHSVKDLGFKQTTIDGNLLTVPAVFLISDGDQRIMKASYGSDFFDTDVFAEVYQQLVFDRVAEE